MLNLIYSNPLWLVLSLCVDTVYLSGDVSTCGYKNKSTCRCCLILSSFLVADFLKANCKLLNVFKTDALRCCIIFRAIKWGLHFSLQSRYPFNLSDQFLYLWYFTLNTEVTFYLWKAESDVLVESHYLSPKMRFDHIKAKLKRVILSVVPYFHMQNV